MKKCLRRKKYFSDTLWLIYAQSDMAHTEYWASTQGSKTNELCSDWFYDITASVALFISYKNWGYNSSDKNATTRCSTDKDFTLGLDLPYEKSWQV